MVKNKILSRVMVYCLLIVIFQMKNNVLLAMAGQLTPTQTVDLYAHADYDGVRLSYGDYMSYITTRLLSLYGTDEVNEGGYDTVYIIKGYKIIEEKMYSDYANVVIRYDILCKIDPNKSICNDRIEDVVVKLVQVNNEWRLKYPIVPPRISIDAGIKDTKRMASYYRNATDASGKRTYKQLKDELKKLESIRKRVVRK